MSIVGGLTPTSPSRDLSPHQSRSPTDSPRRRFWKEEEEEDPQLHTDKNTTRANLERLCSTRLIRRDPKASKLDMQKLQMK
jgi:hypothetical protein